MPSLAMSQYNAILPFISSDIGILVRQIKMSGVMPIFLNSRTECCVGLVFISFFGPTNGTRVT